VDGLDDYLDKVAQTARKSNTNIDTLMEGMVIAGGTFSRFNIPLEEANSFLGLLANRGTKGAEAGTAINSIMDRMTKSTGPAAKAMKELGVSAYDNKGKFRGMEVVMKETQKALSGMTDKQKSNYQSQIAGLNHGKSFEKMMQGLGMEYDGLKKDIQGADGALKEMSDTQIDTFQGSMKLMESAIDDVKITIGEKFAPAVRKMADLIAANMPAIQVHVVNAMGKLSSMKDGLVSLYEKSKPGLEWLKDVAFPAVKEEILNMVNAARPALGWIKDTAFPGIVEGVGTAVEKFTELYGFVKDNLPILVPIVAGVAASVLAFKIGVIGMTVASKAWAVATSAVQVATLLLNGTLALSPFGWVVIAIGLVVAAGVALYQNWDKVKEVTASMGIAISNTWNDIKTVAGKSLNFIIDKINTMIGVINKIPGVNIPIVAKVDWGNAEQPANATKAIKGGMDSYAVGTNRVKRDMVANIHKDEMIIPAAQSRNLRNQGVTIDNVDKPRASAVASPNTSNTSNSKNSIIININAQDKSTKDIVNELVPMLQMRLANI